MTPLKVLTKLFEIRDQAHFTHLNTSSFAAHKALNQFYESWLELTDKFIETYQGKYGRITGTGEIFIESQCDAKVLLTSVVIFLNTDILTILKDEDSDLLNIVAEMIGLTNQTLYMLTLK